LMVAGLFWEKSTAGWWLISQANRARTGNPKIAVYLPVYREKLNPAHDTPTPHTAAADKAHELPTQQGTRGALFFKKKVLFCVHFYFLSCSSFHRKQAGTGLPMRFCISLFQFPFKQYISGMAKKK
jgi:hypothetical protein